MAIVNPIPAEQAAEDVKPIYDGLTKAYGKMPNMFAVMAQLHESVQRRAPGRARPRLCPAGAAALPRAAPPFSDQRPNLAMRGP